MLDVPVEEFAPMPPDKPDVTDIWSMVLLAQDMDGIMFWGDLAILCGITTDQIGFEPEGDTIPSVMGNILLNACLSDPSIRSLPPP